MKVYFWFLIVNLSLGSFSLFSEREPLSILRDDGTTIDGYFDRPEGNVDVPVVIFIDGSHKASVTINHDKLAQRFNPKKIGLISLEKRGIKGDKIDHKEFLDHDCFDERLRDYSLLLNHLVNRKIAGCNGRVILLGGSEGGKIAPRLSLDFSNNVQGIVLISSGGGLSFAEEMKYQSQQLIQQMGSLKQLSYKLRGSLFPKEIDQYYDKMLKSPDSLEMCGPKTWKWFASYLRYDLLSDLLKVKIPIYMIHGEEDFMVPIKSADLIAEAFRQAGKTNLHYARYKNLGHALTGREDVYGEMLDWIYEKSFPE